MHHHRSKYAVAVTLRELERLTIATKMAVRNAADFIRVQAGTVSGIQIEEKFLNGLVSYVDRQAEEMLVAELGRVLPGAAFLTEEGTISTSTGPLQWIIDPLDGTTNFLHQLPHYAVSVGLRLENQLVIGVVEHVPLGIQYYAWLGGGAFQDGQPIRVSERPELRDALVATGFPYHNFDRSAAWFGAMRTFMASTRGVRRFGSAALDLAYVAAGHYDMFFESGLSPWDVAAGALLVTEAGGRVSAFSDSVDFLTGGELLASSVAMYGQSREILGNHFHGNTQTV